VLVLLRQGQVTAAAQLAQAYPLPLSQARVLLAQGQAAAALAVLADWRRQAEAKGWHAERLRGLVLQALAHQAQGDTARALAVLGEALALAEPAGCLRTFVDEGRPMAQLLAAAAAHDLSPAYTARLLAACAAEPQVAEAAAQRTPAALAEALTQRELEVLKLMAEGLSNSEIAGQLFLALSTVKGYNQSLFDKLHVQRRTEAVARARTLGLL
jgi:LuxR family transcriptional regulator, maltose regulon positive regulatory protein